MRMLAFLILAPQLLAAPAKPADTQTAVLAGGCFWGVEAVYEHMRGVRSVESGYAGGESGTANYEKVGTGRSGAGHI
jgi:peptide-methionine (S)-S-oxide reductase